LKVGILGSGPVGQALGRGFIAKRGDEVKIGTRSPDKLDDWVAEVGEAGSAGTPEEAASFAELAVVATGWSGTESAIELAGPDNLAGKVVIDVTNPLDHSSDGPPRLAVGHTDSAGEQVQRWLPHARVVKAFNIVGNTQMVDPDFPDGPPTMFICGDDDAAKADVTRVCADFGWPVSDIGGIDKARYLEPMAMVWVMDAIRGQGFARAFKMLVK
jgi:predicted dinucleotide-binding enzyme